MDLARSASSGPSRRSRHGRYKPPAYPPPAPPDETCELFVLTRFQLLVADGHDHPPLVEGEGSRIGDHVNLEVMRQVKRVDQRSREVRIVVGTPSDESLDTHPVRRHRVDGTH